MSTRPALTCATPQYTAFQVAPLRGETQKRPQKDRPATKTRYSPRLSQCGRVAPAQHLAAFARIKGGARIWPKAATTFAVAHGFGGNRMGEILLLLSCGAAFIAGLVIAAGSLFG
jgi:hypothetical protein